MLIEAYGLMIIWTMCVIVGWYQGRQKIIHNTECHEIKSLFDFFIGKSNE